MKKFFGLMMGLWILIFGSSAHADIPKEVYGGWHEIKPGGETICARGDEFVFFVYPGDKDKVVIDFVGGGACWSEETCRKETAIFEDKVDHLYLRFKEGLNGVYDRTREENPLKNWTYVVVPYCTGDIHWGDNVVQYGEGEKAFTIHHKGATNVKSVLNWVYSNVKNPQKVLMTGTSAGSYGSIYWTPHIRNHYPEAQVFQMGDSGAGIITQEFFDQSFPLWRTDLNAPRWIPTLNPGEMNWFELTLEELYKRIGIHYPDLMLSQFNTALDTTQVFFYEAMGGDGEEWSNLMRNSLHQISQKVENFQYYIGPGIQHMILPEANFYSMKSNDVLFLDWLKGMVNHRQKQNVVCTDCDPLL